MTTFVCASDTHGQHWRLGAVPEGDVFIHAGDALAQGSLENLVDFNDWLGELDFKHKIVIAGNHDIVWEKKPDEAQQLLTNATYLRDSYTLVEGYKIWGTPWTPNFFPEHWVFNHPRKSKTAEDHYEGIDSTVDILVSHGPPYGILDVCPDVKDRFSLLHVGDEVLRTKVDAAAPLLHVFGHIHESRDASGLSLNSTEFYNVAALDGRYRPYTYPYVTINL